MTSQGTASGRFTRAIKQRNLWAAESALRELGHPPTLEYALAYLDLLAEQKPDKLERAAVRWHGRLETEATFLSLAESQLALAALASLVAGERDAVEILRRLLRRVRPTLVPRAL
jgi:NADPH-dependent ferric siderophore reductase